MEKVIVHGRIEQLEEKSRLNPGHEEGRGREEEEREKKEGSERSHRPRGQEKNKEPRKYAGGMARLYRRKEKLGEEKRNLGAGEVGRGQGMTARKTVTGVVGTGEA